jgi:hypothetical protein
MGSFSAIEHGMSIVAGLGALDFDGGVAEDLQARGWTPDGL